MGDDEDRVLEGKLAHEVLDLRGCDRIEGGTRLVHEDDLRPHGNAPRDDEPLLLPAGQSAGALLQIVLDLVPEGCLGEAFLDEVVHIRLDVIDAGPVGDVVVDRLRKHVRLLEDHADLPANLDRIDVRAVDVDAVVREQALDLGPGDEIVHAVEGPQEGRLSAAAWTNERGDLALGNGEGDLTDCLVRTVGDSKVLQVEHHVDDLIGHLLRMSARKVVRELQLDRLVGHGFLSAHVPTSASACDCGS